jgi:adenine specific DNA methylase Mod
MDAVFGPERFLSEIVWKRTAAHSSSKRYGPVHDVILFYSKAPEYVWNSLYTKHDLEYIESHYTQITPDGRRWMPDNLTGAGIRRGETGLPWRGFDVTAKGRHWFVPPAELDKLDASGYIYWPEKPGRWPRFRRYLDESKGVPIQDVWTDIPPLNSQAAERLGYPTQKPVVLLERILKASSDEGDVVLDPFCGCGTAIVAAQHLKRRWIGIDITHLAITLIKHRLQDVYRDQAVYRVIGEPEALPEHSQARPEALSAHAAARG